MSSGTTIPADGENDPLAKIQRLLHEQIPLTRAMLRRMTLLAKLRAEVEAGKSPSAVMASTGKGIFFKEREGIQQQIRRWRSDVIAKSIGRLLDAEREVMTGAGSIAADEELLAICRQAARLRP